MLLFQPFYYSSTLNMWGALSSETSLNFYYSIFRCFPENQFYSSVRIVKISVIKEQVEFIRFCYLNYAPALQHPAWTCWGRQHATVADCVTAILHRAWAPKNLKQSGSFVICSDRSDLLHLIYYRIVSHITVGLNQLLCLCAAVPILISNDFYDVTPYSMVDIYKRLCGTSR